MTKNILQMLERTKSQYPNHIACSDGNGEMTYTQVCDTAMAIGSRLCEMKKIRCAVAVIQEKSKEMLTSFMGIVYSGNFYVPIDTRMPVDRIKLIFDIVRPAAVIADAKNQEKACAVAGTAKVYVYTELTKGTIDAAALSAVRKKSIDTDPVYALFTSGSTGVPKGVVCCHRSVISYADWLVETFAFGAGTIFGSQTPFYFSMSVLDIYATVRSGAHLHIIPRQLFGFPLKLLEYLNSMQINTIYWVPTALCIVANLKALEKVELPYLKNIFFAGEAMPVKQLNIWRKHLPDAMYVNLFGPTEITDIGLYYVVDRIFGDNEQLPIGSTCDNVDILILDDMDCEVPRGQIGELCVRGSFLALGYYDNAEKTGAAFVQNPLHTHYPEIIYKTGDLVHENERGELMYHGRKDFQIKHRGNRIELGEVENAAGGVRGIEMCACIYDRDEEKIVLFYQAADAMEKEIMEKEIRKGMLEKVPDYMIPNVMICKDRLPENQNGKIDRKALERDYMADKHLCVGERHGKNIEHITGNKTGI